VTPAAPVAAKKKSKAPLIVAGVAVLVLVLALVGVFTQGFGLFGGTEETNGSMAGGSETPVQDTTPGETPAPEPTPGETPTPESPPPETPSPESPPPETPTPESPPDETPTPEPPPPELPVNHISEEFLDVLINGDNFYLSYMHYTIQGELYGYVEYVGGIISYSPEFVELARQGDLYVHRESYWAFRWWDHYFYTDNKVYQIFHRYPGRDRRERVEVGDLGQVTSAGVSAGRLTGYVGDVSWSSSHEYVGSGVGAVNGVQMPYDEYAVSHWGMDIPFRLLFYMDGGTVVFLATYAEGEPIESFAFSEAFWSDPPGDFGIPSVGLSRDVPQDIFDLDYYLENYPIEQSDSPPPRPTR